jgi:hypothetical protein
MDGYMLRLRSFILYGSLGNDLFLVPWRRGGGKWRVCAA